MPRKRSIFASAPAALFTALIVGASALSCRPAADLSPSGPAIRLIVHTQPGDAHVGVAIGSAPVVNVVDRNEALITQAALTVRASIDAGAAQISAGGEASVVNGVATFSNLTFTGTANASIRLRFTLVDNGVANVTVFVTATAFPLNAGPPANVRATSTAAIAGAPGTVVTPAPAVLVTDISQNLLAGIPVAFSVTAGEGRVNGSAQQSTDASGVAAVPGWVLGLPGTNQLVATVSPALQVTFTAAVTSATGMLRVRLAGQPAGATAHVRVVKTSASGVTYDAFVDVHDSLTVTNLPFGTYQITGDSVKVGSRIWMPDASLTGLNVGATNGPSVVLSYREHGRIEVTTRGLTQPTSTATIDFLPTAGLTASLFSLVVLNDAITRGLGPVGTYNVVPRVVVIAGQQFTSTPAQQSVPIAGGDSIARMTFTYAVITGTLTVDLAGSLPAGAAPQVDVTGPGGFHDTVFMSTATRSWLGLAPGNYTIVASSITVSGVTYKPAPTTSSASVSAGTETHVTITYSP